MDKPYQFLFIKRHPCIVECDPNGYPGVCSTDNNKKPDGVLQVGPDELDNLFMKLGIEFKKYDYPEADVSHPKKG